MRKRRFASSSGIIGYLLFKFVDEIRCGSDPIDDPVFGIDPCNFIRSARRKSLQHMAPENDLSMNETVRISSFGRPHQEHVPFVTPWISRVSMPFSLNIMRTKTGDFACLRDLGNLK